MGSVSVVGFKARLATDRAYTTTLLLEFRNDLADKVVYDVIWRNLGISVIITYSFIVSN